MAAVERQLVTLIGGAGLRPVDMLFRQPVPKGVLVVAMPRGEEHHHTYGGLTPFFEGLAQGKLLGTRDEGGTDTGIWLPPRVDSPDTWRKMRWVEVDTSEAKVYTYSKVLYPGAGFMLENLSGGGVPLISVEIPGVCTKLMSYLSEFGEGEPYIGMRVRPVFRTEDPTHSILDLSWVPVD